MTVLQAGAGGNGAAGGPGGATGGRFEGCGGDWDIDVQHRVLRRPRAQLQRGRARMLGRVDSQAERGELERSVGRGATARGATRSPTSRGETRW